LVVVMLATFVWTTSAEVERTLIGAGRDRARAGAEQLSQMLRYGIVGRLAESERLRSHPAIKTVLRNPTRSDNLVVTYRVDRPNYSALLEHSQDGGESWAQTELPVPPGTPACSATVNNRPCPFGPDMAFGRDGKLYVTYVNLTGTGNSPANLWLSTSPDGGRTG
jgi:hypothetical protein